MTIYYPPGSGGCSGQLQMSADASVAGGGANRVYPFDTLFWSKGGITLASNRLVVPTGGAGIYLAEFFGGVSGGDAGVRAPSINVNGTAVGADPHASFGNSAFDMAAITQVQLANGDAVGVTVFITGASNVTLLKTTASTALAHLSLTRIA